MAKSIMVQGTMSDAGKSVLAAALCRIFTQDGYRVAPFKGQNMALNSYVTRDGLEMGRAQVMQAEACRIEPDVRMNPVLLKPSSDTGSQLIVMGEIRGQMTAEEYYQFKGKLLPEVKAAYDSLAAENDIIVIEGAGSPAEINLMDHDLANMGIAEMADAPVILVGDIDRGGVFAQLYGTSELLPPEQKDRIRAFIINKFRGDVGILEPGLKMLEEKSGKPVLGVIPMLDVDLDDEDSLASRLKQDDTGKPIDICVIRLPRLSNFTDFNALTNELMGVRYARKAAEVGDPDLIIIPGTKNTVDDLVWMRENGIESEVLKHAVRGKPVLGVCGGYQMLGETLKNPEHLEGDIPELRGMGLLPCSTVFTPDKRRTRVQGTVTYGPFAGARIDGYEIHMGRTEVAGEPFCRLDNGTDDGCCQGKIFGTYLHGLFDTGELVERMTRWLAAEKGIEAGDIPTVSHEVYVQQQYNILAEGVRRALDMEKIYEILNSGGKTR
ncbi:MAG: cobyric acid synthase [Anaerovoracaceae bacterium]|jgi:adenosylcobyric acid synthase